MLNMSVVLRLQEIAKEKSKSIRSFEIEIGKSVGYLKTMEKRGGLPGADVLIKIRELHPDIDMNWLLTGEGAMYIKRSDIVEEPSTPYKSVTINIVDGESSPLIKALEALIKKETKK